MTGYLLFLGFVALIGISAIVTIYVTSSQCDHEWTLIKNAELLKYDRFGKEVPYGYIRVHECEKCKKLKKQQVEM